jgi:hypothetical protein
MLTIQGSKVRFCDGVTRRAFFKIGGFAFGGLAGLSLPQLLRAEEHTGRRLGHKALINVFLGGGPPHQDLWEIKTEAPAEIRGEFKPINTSAPGVQICEVFTRVAKLMHKAAVVRSVVGAHGGHDAWQCMTGWRPQDLNILGGYPSIGAAVAKIQGPTDPGIPPFVGLAAATQHAPWSDPGSPGYLGPAYKAFKPEGPGMDDLVLKGVTVEQLADRRKLLASFDTLRRDIDASGMMKGMDAFTERALGVLLSGKLRDALDISKEHPRVRERYGDGKPYKFQYDGAPTVNEQFLIARRLVEAGVRCVTFSYGRWDSHGKNFDLVRDHGSKLDQALSALLEDLDQRGLLNDVSVVVWGEFGRTPRINKDAGRDHWPQVSCAFLAGGGMKGGRAIGATNRLGEHAVERPVHFQEIIATLYYNLGIDPRTTTVNDPLGRPQYLVEKNVPLPELV